MKDYFGRRLGEVLKLTILHYLLKNLEIPFAFLSSVRVRDERCIKYRKIEPAWIVYVLAEYYKLTREIDDYCENFS